MNAEIICVGTELLLGGIVNTNAQFLSQELAHLGINVYNQSVVGDNLARIKEAVLEASRRSDIVILTGGLGPTDDDITREAVSEAYNLPLAEDPETTKRITAYFERRQMPMAKSNFKQAFFPKESQIIPNDIGTAPGFCVNVSQRKTIVLPGPPHEMQAMFKSYVAPLLKSLSPSVLVSHNIGVFGEMESQLNEKLNYYFSLQNPTTAPYAKDGIVTLRVTASGKSEIVAENTCNPVIKGIKEILGDNIFDIDSEGINYTVVNLLKKCKLRVATAESCTAGLLSAALTDVPGSSSVFDMGISAYANHVKVSTLGVPADIIRKHGAVSAETAACMAEGIVRVSSSDIGIGITGVAGPDSSENKPVGLVYVGLSDGKNTWVRKMMLGHGGNEREKIRIITVNTALDMLRRYLVSLPGIMSGSFAAGTAPVVITDMPNVYKAEVKKASLSAGDLSANQQLSDEQIIEVMETSFYEQESKDDTEYGGYDNGVYGAEDMSFVKHMTGINTEPQESENKIVKTGNKILHYFLPYKSDGIKEIIRKSVFLLAIIGMIASGIYIGSYLNGSAKQESLIAEVRKEYNAEDDTISTADGHYRAFDPLSADNPDTAAWISIKDTDINYPVLQCDNNDYYLNHNFYNQKSRFGALFFDKSNVIERFNVSKNLIIYGHNMKNGSMFGKLKKFKNVDYCKTHQFINLRTLYAEKTYKIFAVMILDSQPEQTKGYVFTPYCISFSLTENFQKWIYAAKARSIITSDLNIEDDDHILTLSTCSNEFKTARLVILAKEIENENLTISKITATVNPRYPQAYYDAKKIENPFANTVENYDNLVSHTQSSSENETPEEPEINDVSSEENPTSGTTDDNIPPYVPDSTVPNATENNDSGATGSTPPDETASGVFDVTESSDIETTETTDSTVQ